jgi:penicillin amidase
VWRWLKTASLQYKLRLPSVLKYLNVLIGLALILFLAAAYWYAWRPLPKTSGELTAPIGSAATVTRDALGVPHIEAESIEDAIFLQGYVTAQDRLWQMDALRRLASGNLSEIIGERTLDVDRETRRLRMGRLAEEHTARLSAADRKWIAAYARGVNHFIATHWNALPLEFTLLDYQPRPWRLADTMAAGMQMYRDMTSSWKADIGKAAMLSNGDPKLIAQLYPPRTGFEIQPGSNAWAVAGSRTATGKPILANDPHLEWGFPSAWYMVHLKAPGLNVAGSSLPGVPGVIVGHNDRIAWGVTNLHFDVQDLYIERLNPQTGQYVVDGRVEQARPEREVIPVKGRRPVEFTNWVTRHGPIWTVAGTQSFALRWAAAEAPLEFPIIEINQATNWDAFRNALRRFHGPGQNFVYADVAGNIGYQATGKLPVRRGFAGDVPVDGTSSGFEWQGFIPFDELPSTFNPSSGLIVTANQNPFPENWKYPVHGSFDAGFRARQISAMLNARSGWRPEEMVTVQKDVYSPFLHALTREVVAAASKRRVDEPMVNSAVALLRSWNGQMEKGNSAPMIARLFYEELRRRMAERASPVGPASYTNTSSPAVVLTIVRERRAGWFGDWDKTIIEALQAALEAGRKLQGSNVERWDYGQMMSLALKNPVISQIPYLGAYFDVGPVPMSGSPTSVKQTSARLGPSMRFVADTSNWDRSLNSITLGQSGQILSRHYKDQWDEYWSGKSLPMQWSNVQGDVLQFVSQR